MATDEKTTGIHRCPPYLPKGCQEMGEFSPEELFEKVESFPLIDQFYLVCHTPYPNVEGKFGILACPAPGATPSAQKKPEPATPPPEKEPGEMPDTAKQILWVGLSLAAWAAYRRRQQLRARLTAIGNRLSNLISTLRHRRSAASQPEINQLRGELAQLRTELRNEIDGATRWADDQLTRFRRGLQRPLSRFRGDFRSYRDYSHRRLLGMAAQLARIEQAVRELEHRISTQRSATPPPQPAATPARGGSLEITFSRYLSSISAPAEVRAWFSRLPGTERQAAIRSITRIWEDNEALRRLFPMERGNPRPRFVQIAMAIVKGDTETLRTLTVRELRLQAAVELAWEAEGIARGESRPSLRAAETPTDKGPPLGGGDPDLTAQELGERSTRPTAAERVAAEGLLGSTPPGRAGAPAAPPAASGSRFVPPADEASDPFAGLGTGDDGPPPVESPRDISARSLQFVVDEMHLLDVGLDDTQAVDPPPGGEEVVLLDRPRRFAAVDIIPTIDRLIEQLRTQHDVPEAEIPALRSLAEGILRVWCQNQGLRDRYPLEGGRTLQQPFLEIAIAIVRNDLTTLDRLRRTDTEVERLINEARIRYRPGPAIRQPRRARDTMRMHRVALRPRPRLRWRPQEPRGARLPRAGAVFQRPLNWLESWRGPAVAAAPLVGLDVAEYYGAVTPVGKGVYLTGWAAGLTYFNRFTPGHIALLYAPFELGRMTTQAGLRAAGVSSHSLTHTAGGTVGGLAAAEGAIVAIGKGAGAATLKEAHHLGAKVLQDSLVHAAEAAPRVAAAAWTSLKTFAVGTAATVAGISGTCWAVGAAPGIVVGGAIHVLGAGRYLGTDWLGEKIGDYLAGE